MKLKIILSVLLLFSLLKVDANPLVDISIASGKEEVFLHSNDIPFEILTTGKEDGSRSVIPLVPFVVFVEDSNYSVELDFMEGIGVVEIAIYNPQIQISAESGTKRSIFRQKNKTKRSKKRLHTTLIKPEQKVNEDLCSGFIVS